MTDTAPHPTAPLSVSLKEAAVLLPTIISALAITLDVGFFYAVDSSLLSVFSLSEHLAFALIMVPFAVSLLLLVAILMAIKKPTGEETPQGIRFVWWLDRILYIGLIAVGFWVWFRLEMYTVLGLGLMVGILWVTVSSGGRLAVVIGAVASTFAMAFSLGSDLATLMMVAPEKEHIIKLDSGDQRGVMMRSGERGVLFYDAKAKSPSLLKWDQIKNITSIRPTEDSWTKTWRLLSSSNVSK